MELTSLSLLICAPLPSKPLSHRLSLHTIKPLFNEPFLLRTAKTWTSLATTRRKALWEMHMQHQEKASAQIGNLVAGDFQQQGLKARIGKPTPLASTIARAQVRTSSKLNLSLACKALQYSRNMANSTPLLPLKIDVTSDTICPFCFLGLRKLEKALELSPYTSPSSASRLFNPEIQYLPYQLDPTLPEDRALSKKEMYTKKFGAARFDAMEKMMVERGKEVGINFIYGGTVRSTMLSHRLLAKAHQVGGWKAQLAFLNLVFPYYFEKQGDPGDAEALAMFAHQASIFSSKSEADAFCKSDELTDEVRKGFVRARRAGITGVPNFEMTAQREGNVPVVAEVPGAQDPETLAAIIKQIAQKVQAQSHT
ncbi:thioredoxin-like protein [Tilletiaria anomala UBC 951]|uniref:Thioredoxin-like protein n=1 Tax=Tilletiaria anomala (strain ATCC 24038 / CBS 436.72 / UBC 951) TaxID=1037660 RepID=A0A066WE38_TILAU|nr:thioredoxin-like protein [Tilletiaria anomala UBC 951]KDN52026.1 thioredoxin-like protein [Tilletiaria anomala UBC 951]